MQDSADPVDFDTEGSFSSIQAALLALILTHVGEGNNFLIVLRPESTCISLKHEARTHARQAVHPVSGFECQS